MTAYFEGRLKVSRGDITAYTGDGIINAANSSLYGGGGVDGAIHRAGGGAVLEECRRIRKNRYPEGLPTGRAVSTGAGELPCRRVIHTVGPVWHGGNQGESRLLAEAYENCLKIAVEEELSSVAFPAVSTGIYGFPKEKAAGIVLDVMKNHFASHSLPEQVDLVFFSASDENLFNRIAQDYFK